MKKIDDFGSRLKLAMTEAEVSRKELASHLGISVQAIGMAIAGQSKAFTAENNAIAAEFLNCNSMWLATGKGSPSSSSGVRQIYPTNSVPVLTWSEARNWQKVIDGLSGEFDKILVNMPVNRYTYALKIVDDSNISQFPIGSWVVIEPSETPTSEKWCIVDDSGSQASLKQLVIDGSTSYLRSDKFPIKEMVKNAKFCGTAKQVIFQNNL